MANDFNPNVTQRVTAAVRKRIVKDPQARWYDLSSRFARYGLVVQSGVAMLPDTVITKTQSAIVGAIFFIAIGIAKMISEERNQATNQDDHEA